MASESGDDIEVVITNTFEGKETYIVTRGIPPGSTEEESIIIRRDKWRMLGKPAVGSVLMVNGLRRKAKGWNAKQAKLKV